MEPLFWHRLQFAFTIVFHYLFPVLTMGLALLIVVMKALALRNPASPWGDASRFWLRIFAINFVVGVVTGIPMEFQFGTNWANFARIAGGVIGQTLAMEGVFAFFLESSVLGLLIFGEKRLGPVRHFWAAVALFIGSWLSAYFIIVTNAFMQHPVGHAIAPDGTLQLADFGAYLGNPWAWVQFAHNQCSTVATASFVVAAVGAFWTLRGEHAPMARCFLRLGTRAGLVASLLVAFPTGDLHAKAVARHQPVTLAAMEGRFHTGPMAELNMIGQPNVKERRLDNPLPLPGVLSFLAFGTVSHSVQGLEDFPEQNWPDNIELLYYAFHIMAGIGTMMIALMLLAAGLEWRGALARARPVLWALMLAFPFPYIAVTAGWMTAELGRQPWLVYGILRTADGASPTVHAGSALFTLIGTCGIYFVLGALYLALVGREVARGPAPEPSHG